MKKIILSIAALLVLASCKPTDEQVEKAVAKYIEEHPELFEGAAPTKEREVSKKTIENSIEKILADKSHPVIGDKNSKDVVIEFYDYNCGYCKRSLENILKLSNDDKVKVVLVELPVLGPESAYAAQASLVVNKIAPEKFLNFHSDLLNFQGHAGEEQIQALAIKAGVDKAKFAEEMAKTSEYGSILQENTKIARSLNIGGTPSFIVNGEVVRGAVPYEVFKQILQK